MPQTIADVLTANPETVQASQTVREAAELMRARDIGDVLVVDGGQLVGIVTDRDLVVRVLAMGGSGQDQVRMACSETLVTVSPTDSLEQAAALMREHDVRRLPVVDGGELVGIVSIGDLAIERDSGHVLRDISAAEPNS